MAIKAMLYDGTLPAELFDSHDRRRMDWQEDCRTFASRKIDAAHKVAVFTDPDKQTVCWFWDEDEFMYVRHDDSVKTVRLYPAKAGTYCHSYIAY